MVTIVNASGTLEKGNPDYESLIIQLIWDLF